MKQTIMKAALLAGITALSIVGVWGFRTFLTAPSIPLKKLSIACMSPSFTGYTTFVAFEKGYFRAEGLNVELRCEYPHGQATLNAVITGETDLATSSETPFMHAALDGSQLYALATTITAEKHLAIVARKDRGISHGGDLKGKTIGVTLGSNGEYFLDTVLLLHGLAREDIRTVDLNPNQMVTAILQHDVDAIATWNPQMSQARQALGEQCLTLYAEGLYVPAFLIVARREFVHSNPDIAQRVIRALVKATRDIRANPLESRRIVAPYINIEESLFAEFHATYCFKIALDQALLLTLEHQTEWAIRHHLTTHSTIPNYLEFLYTDALDAVKPENVNIIR